MILSVQNGNRTCTSLRMQDFETVRKIYPFYIFDEDKGTFIRFVSTRLLLGKLFKC